MAKTADIYFKVDPWKIIEEGFDPAYSRVSESVFSLANETTGVRGCFDEDGSVDSLRGAYVNGVFDIEQLQRSYRGIVDHTHFMIPSAEWLKTEITADGEKLDLGQIRFHDFRRELDMRAGTLTRSFIWETETGKKLKFWIWCTGNGLISGSPSKHWTFPERSALPPDSHLRRFMRDIGSASGRNRIPEQNRI